MNFRDLRADEIEVRIGQVKEYGVSLLLYKNARCDMNILDETVCPENWQREHYECKGNMYCKVGIYSELADGSKAWVWKSDCGIESNADAEKGEASDSFKRACVNWGIGRELYSAPFIWVNADGCKIENKGNGYKCNDKFVVERIITQDKKITALSIVNKNNNLRVFVMKPEVKKGE